MRQWRGVRKAALSLLLVAAASLAIACGRQDSSLRISNPDFGPGRVRFEVRTSKRMQPNALRVRLDGQWVMAQVTPTAQGATLSFPATPGRHLVAVVGRFDVRGESIWRGDQRWLQVPVRAPALLRSEPGAGAQEVSTAAWLDLEFTGPVSPSTLRTFSLRCGRSPIRVDVHRLGRRRIVVNPAPALLDQAACRLRWSGADGVDSLAFHTGGTGAGAVALYDRDDPRSVAPFPDDLWRVDDPTTRTGARLAVSVPDGPVDVQKVLGSLIAEANLADGFSPLGPFVVELSGAPDPATIPTAPAASLDPLAPVALIDLSPGVRRGLRVPFHSVVRSEANALGVVSHSLILFPSIPLEPEGRYGLVVTRRVTTEGQRPVEPSSWYAAALQQASSNSSPHQVAARRMTAEVLSATGRGSVPIPVEDVALVLRISVRSVEDLPRDLRAIKEQVLAAPAPELQLNQCLPISDERCLDDDDPNSDVAGCILGSFRSPDWRESGNFARDTDGLPRPVLEGNIPFVLALPKADPGARVPVTMYQHGNPGSAEGEVPGAARHLAGAGFAVAGFTDNLNREVTSGVTDPDVAIQGQVFAILVGILGQQRVPDYWAETNAEQLVFLRALESLAMADLTGFCESEGVEGVPGLDLEAPLTYLGISQGANHAPGLLPYAPEIRAAALVVGGARLVEVLIHQGADTLVSALVTLFPNLTPAEIWVGFALFQGNFDRQDQHNHARFLYREPFEVAGTMRKASVLVTEGLDDSRVPNAATESLAGLLGPLPHLEPVQRPVPFLNPARAPLVGNLGPGTTAGFFQYVPDGIPGLDPTPGCTGQDEGHFCAQSAAEARRQRLIFFESAVTDVAPIIVNPLIP